MNDWMNASNNESMDIFMNQWKHKSIKMIQWKNKSSKKLINEKKSIKKLINEYFLKK